jgi:hypothetical protein
VIALARLRDFVTCHLDCKVKSILSKQVFCIKGVVHEIWATGRVVHIMLRDLLTRGQQDLFIFDLKSNQSLDLLS